LPEASLACLTRDTTACFACSRTDIARLYTRALPARSIPVPKDCVCLCVCVRTGSSRSNLPLQVGYLPVPTMPCPTTEIRAQTLHCKLLKNCTNARAYTIALCACPCCAVLCPSLVYQYLILHYNCKIADSLRALCTALSTVLAHPDFPKVQSCTIHC
jgi:hypothetical protein